MRRGGKNCDFGVRRSVRESMSSERQEGLVTVYVVKWGPKFYRASCGEGMRQLSASPRKTV